MEATKKALFLPHHALDRYAFPLLVALIWGVILMGFVPEIIGKAQKNELHYPLLTHLHAAVFVGWLLLLTTQVALIRGRNIRLHRKLGIWGAFHALAVVIFGLLVSVAVQRRDIGTPHGNPAEFSFALADVINFAWLAGAGLLLRKTPAAHKRLMLLATICITDPGFSRWCGDSVLDYFGKGFFGEWGFDYLGGAILIAGLGGYDLITRHRLHPAYAIGASWALGLQLLATYLYLSPWWKPIAIELIGQ
ncbi:MAG TPA: hypothetical protein VIE67_14455 [Rudaea sp.]|jgi:hypothetical protein|uniref:hypothetical protein n=1 Tax=Rudaea sp. TaxID=2136325 RepID=UPI002F95877E